MPVSLKYAVVIILLVVLFFDCEAGAQNAHGPVVITQGRIVDGDTLPHVNLPEFRKYARRKFKSRRAWARYTRLVHNVKKTLPYARIAAVKITEIEDSLAKIDNPKLRKKYLKDAEDKLFAEFEKPLRKLTISQGRILIKLIDRETGDTSYELIKNLKGRFSAFLWQSVARLFGSSLKSEYDPEKDDREIEAIVQMIDDGIYPQIRN